MSFRNPRLGPPLALLSSFKLFLIAIAIGAEDLGCPAPDPAWCTTRKYCAARYAVGCHLMYTDFSRAVLYTHGRGSARATFSMCEETPSYLRRAGHSSSSATDAHETRKAK